MNLSLTISLIANFILFILLMLIVIYGITSSSSQKIITNSNNSVCPINNEPRTPLPYQVQKPYALKTLSGRYVQSCFDCLASPISCFQQGMIAAEEWNGDTVELMSASSGLFNLKLNSIKNPTGNYYLNMVRSNDKYILCITQDSQQISAMFEIIPYLNDHTSNLYQIATPVSNSLLGESEPSCLVKEGLTIEDGFNITPNARHGMNERSFFLMLSAK